jgi:GTP diphosphokinase / guanosine-3',5'-bis(diphosphate) 3'-diphosphatase
VNHLAEVAELVATATEGRDANLVAAAVLHDTVEDTATLPGELASIFNTDVADLVSDVTDDKQLDKAERKRLLVEHAAAITPRAKIADKDNITLSIWSVATDDTSFRYSRRTVWA